MSVTYSTAGESFEAGKPTLWSDGQFASRSGYGRISKRRPPVR
jgi:hypothetical protein